MGWPADEAASILKVHNDVHDAPQQIQLRCVKALIAMGRVSQADPFSIRIVAADPNWLSGFVTLCDALRSQKKITDVLNVY
jgi:hypothetical protein